MAPQCTGCRRCVRSRTTSGSRWDDPINHNGARMDGRERRRRPPDNVSEVVTHIHSARAAGMGVISMKLFGAGTFTNRADRQQAMRFAFRTRA